jgi:uncharacterized protein YyaL (SSP411 family)
MTQTTATHAGLRWLTWNQDVFEQAAKEDKLILLDIGASWCHWCHVMDRVTYEDAELVALLREKFLAVRVDRDRLPQVDERFQGAHPLAGGPSAGGWPLTCVLTPQGDVLFKATFVPPRADPVFGAGPGLIDLLRQLDAYWRGHRDEIRQASREVARLVQGQTGAFLATSGKLTGELVSRVAGGIKGAYDSAHGGFGAAPKFFHASALELLLARAWSGDREAEKIALHTLEAIAAGGVFDQVGGGLHRYSVDQRWHVPHFEKMASDNAAMLANFANAYAMSQDERFARAARRILDWVGEVLWDRGGRGFYGSQDADVGLDDDGDYFTWTIEEVRAVLGDETDLAVDWYDLDKVGDVHGRPGRNVLHTPHIIARRPSLAAASAESGGGGQGWPPPIPEGMTDQELEHKAAAWREKLLAARRRRATPAVDTTIFADINGMMIDAHLTAFERLGEARARDAALQAADALLENLRDHRGVFGHYRQADELRNVGMLPDQAWMAKALLHAYAATAAPKYLEAARQAADYILENLRTPDGSFVSSIAPPPEAPAEMPALRQWEDNPSRSAGSVAAQMLIELSYLTRDDKYRAAAGKALASAAGDIHPEWGLFLGGYALSVSDYLHGPRSVVMVAVNSSSSPLAQLVRNTYIPSCLTLLLDPRVPDEAALIKRLGYPLTPEPAVYVCQGDRCLAPARTLEDFRERLTQLCHG